MKLFSAVPLTLLGLTLVSHSANGQALKAGAGAAEIQTSADMLPVEGYASQHDPISSRVLLLDNGGLRIGILVVDTPSIQDSFIDSWKAILAKVAAVKPENALVIASHDTSAPHVSSGSGPGAGGGPGGAPPSPAAVAHAKAFAQAVDTSVESAASKALATLQPVQLGFGLGTSRSEERRVGKEC